MNSCEAARSVAENISASIDVPSTFSGVRAPASAVKVGKMSGFRLIGTEKGPKVYTTHVMQKLAMPDGRVLDAHGRAESGSQKESSAGGKELAKILDSMKP